MMKKLFLLIAVAGFAVPVFADISGEDWNFYGSARMSGFYWDRHLYYGNDQFNNNKYYEDTFPLKRYIWDLEYISRFGTNIKKDHYGFRFELGWGPTFRELDVTFNGTEPTVTKKVRDGLVLRRLFGEWYINDYMKLLIGQEWCLANFFPSAQVFNMEDGLCYSGALFTGRKPQVRFSVGDNKNPAFNWEGAFSIVKPDTFIIVIGSTTPEAEEKTPKLEGGANFEVKQNILGINCGLKTQLVYGINRYDLVANRWQGKLLATTTHVKANCAGFNADLNVWKCRLSLSGAQGDNLASYGVAMGNPWGSRSDADIRVFYPIWGSKTDTGTTLELCNAFTKQGCAVFNIKPFNFLALEAGAGIVVNHQENYQTQVIQAASVANLMRRFAYYGNVQFTLLDGHMLLIPEFSFSDLSGQQGAGKWWAYGFLLEFNM